MPAALAELEPNEMLDHALGYAEMGFPVFPVHARGKAPLTQHGFKDASTDATTIRGWWGKRWPTANIGLAVPESYLVVDVDSEDALNRLRAEDLALPATTTARTGRGQHFWYATNGVRVKNGVGVLPGVDVRSTGGYVVVPPSIHKTGAVYAWVVPLARDRIAPAPDWLLKRLGNKSTAEGSDREAVDIARLLAGVPEGQRDATLFRFACRLRHADVPREWAERLVGEAAANCAPPFPEKDARAKVASAYDRYKPGQVHNVGFVSSEPGQFKPVRSLPLLLPEAPELPPELLPDRLRPWLVDISERMQVTLEFVAVPALTALSAVAGRRIGIHPKAHDDWLVVPNLWGGIVARPGKLKSPTLVETLKPIRRLEADAREQYRRERREAESRLDSMKARETSIRDQMRKVHGGKRTDRTPEQLVEELAAVREDIGGLEAELVVRRYIVNDSTTEKLGQLLTENPQGLLLARDELAGWLRSLEREDRKGDREFYLEAWNGTGSFTYDRIGRGTLVVPALCLSIIGGIQPQKLSRFISEALEGGYAADGFLQRFQLLVWPEDRDGWRLVDKEPRRHARQDAFEVFSAIDRFVGPEAELDSIPALRFSSDAQQLFYDWLSTLETRLRSSAMKETPAFESHLAKYRSLMPSLALLFHLAATHGEYVSVSLSAAQCAADWCEFLEMHACKVYAAELRTDLTGAHALAKKVRQEAVYDGMTLREIYRAGWTNLKDADSVLSALAVLEEHGWARLEVIATGRRPSQIVRVNPAARETKGGV